MGDCEHLDNPLGLGGARNAWRCKRACPPPDLCPPGIIVVGAHPSRTDLETLGAQDVPDLPSHPRRCRGFIAATCRRGRRRSRWRLTSAAMPRLHCSLMFAPVLFCADRLTSAAMPRLHCSLTVAPPNAGSAILTSAAMPLLHGSRWEDRAAVREYNLTSAASPRLHCSMWTVTTILGIAMPHIRGATAASLQIVQSDGEHHAEALTSAASPRLNCRFPWEAPIG